tara:strand:- start:344 stop:670 length:327 start_codon:yes stop_codon:yes gene_type:complete
MDRDKFKKKYLEMEDEYRLSDPLYNIIHDMHTGQFGLTVGALSGFIFMLIVGSQNEFYFWCILVGLIAELFAHFSRQRFTKYKISKGFNKSDTIYHMSRETKKNFKNF